VRSKHVDIWFLGLSRSFFVFFVFFIGQQEDFGAFKTLKNANEGVEAFICTFLSGD
jgi:hypothetical protein